MVVAGAVQDPPLCPMCRQPVTGSEEVTEDIIMEQQPERVPARDAVASFAYLLRSGGNTGALPMSSTMGQIAEIPYYGGTAAINARTPMGAGRGSY